MMTLKELVEDSGKLFGARTSLLSLWQELADHFYPERADFTYHRYLGSEFVEYLMTSYPILVRRDLGNAFASMLRPTQKEWFHIVPKGDEVDNEGKRWLSEKTKRQRRIMYERSSMFVRATKEGDHDFATFGQCVLSVTLNKLRNGVLYRCWHLRDTAWREDEEGKINTVYRKWKPTAVQLKNLFGEDALHDRVKALVGTKEQHKEINCQHVVMPVDIWNEGKYRTEYVSMHVDIENEHIIEEVGINHFEYILPRWQTVSGSQYAYSPATIVGLPDARLIQAMTRVLLEAGEKATNPPMVATEEVVRTGINVYAGGVTWVDAEYDERLGDALRPISQDTSGIPLGLDMLQDMRNQIAEAFYINKLSLPQVEREMTAFETAQRIEEYIRQSLPLFEPMEMEYNGTLCEATFDLLMSNGAFGPVDDIPRMLRGREVEFKFESPLHDAVERVKGQEFLQAKQMLLEAAEVDPDAIAHLDVHTAIRDAFSGLGIDPKWITPEQTATQKIQQSSAARAASAKLQQAGMAAEVGKTAAEAGSTASGIDMEKLGL